MNYTCLVDLTIGRRLFHRISIACNGSGNK
jgi:hypothetical protein